MSVEIELEESVGYTPLQRMRHSAAHVMAEAVQEIFPDARFGIGPAIEDGFYYDFELPRALTPDDLPDIEKRMARIVAGKYPFVRDRWPREKALEYFRDKGQVYKVELIENLPDAEVGIFQQHNFLDLCRGPHVANARSGRLLARRRKSTHAAAAVRHGVVHERGARTVPVAPGRGAETRSPQTGTRAQALRPERRLACWRADVSAAW